MKKIFILLAFTIGLFALKSTAQQTCNPSFTWQFINNTTVKFTAAVNNDTSNLFHFWNFGDGATSNLSSPTHTYTPSGSYLVKHRIYRQSTGGIPTCNASDSTVISFNTTPPVCNLSASFTKDSLAPFQYHFTNTSTAFEPGDSIQWSFGDGGISYDINPNHTYANVGNYTVCLRVKKANTIASTPACSSITCMTFYVSAAPTTNPCATVQPYFIIDTIQNNVVHFTNQSTGTAANDSTIWYFGDGTTSTQTNPTHTYTNAGTYNVCLVIKKFITNSTFCTKEYCKTVTVTLPCNLTANFNWYRDSTAVNIYTYHFNNTTTPVSTTDSVRWSFGDGTFSNQYSPNHSYAQAGTYTVCLRMQKRNPNGVLTNCVSEKCYQVTVTAPNTCNLQVYFSQSIDSAQPNTVHFTNQTVNYAPTDSITWTFGDGTTSHDANPTHVYATAGTYTVCLVIKKNNPAGTTSTCIREYCKSITIAQSCTLVANYTYYRDSTALSINTYHFTNTSTGLQSTDSIRWTFGDGTSSSQVNPTHVYAQAGTYSVCLRIIKRNANGSLQNCVKEICKTITIPQNCTLVAQYSSYADSINRKKIYFTNTSSSAANTALSTLWSFGDGSTATTYNAIHEYAQPGRYYVCLRVQYGSCVSYKCDSITVIASPPTCTQLSKYTFVRSTTNPAIVTFTPNFISADVQYTWTFGDGTGAQTATATHQFANTGYYSVCLTAYRNNNCASTTCNTVQILPNCNNITLAIADVRDSLVPNRVTFSVVGNTATTSQTWKITKIPATVGTGTVTIYQNNPTYVFLDSGYYNVCVRTTYANGCVKELCKIIHINQNMPATNSCTLQVYPNPASSTVTAVVTLVQPTLISATIFNSMNMQVAQIQQQGVVGNNSVTVNVASIPAGIYTIRVVYGNQVCYATFIKQ